MFLSGTILRQIAHATPALTRPARRRDLEKIGFRLRCQWRQGRQCCPEASPGGPASSLAACGPRGASSSLPGDHDSSGGQCSRPADRAGPRPTLVPADRGAASLSAAVHRCPTSSSSAARRCAASSSGAACRGAACMSSCRGRACPTGTGPPGAGKARWAGAGSRSRSCQRLRMGCPWSRLTGRTGSLSAAADQTPCDLRVTAGCAFGRG